MGAAATNLVVTAKTSAHLCIFNFFCSSFDQIQVLYTVTFLLKHFFESSEFYSVYILIINTSLTFYYKRTSCLIKCTRTTIPKAWWELFRSIAPFGNVYYVCFLCVNIKKCLHMIARLGQSNSTWFESGKSYHSTQRNIRKDQCCNHIYHDQSNHVLWYFHHHQEHRR